ncbi:MAG: acyltransferase [Cellvibrio sp.]|uniref:acyltransferase family protein n=1 Tax=Cellvibrio sp. TaxID=1965322 RepID=UPI0031AD934F
MSDEAIKQSGRVALLDLLRFVAAFLVVLYHYQPFMSNHTDSEILEVFKFGYLGVNFFFMLSGFVIMSSAKNRTAFKFAILRAVRLYPAFICCLIITVFILYYLDGRVPSMSQMILNGLIINDYFGVENIDGVYWTLQAELKFYGCIFLLILFSMISHYRIWISLWLLCAVTFYFYTQPFFLGWFISPSYSFFFIGGVSAYYLYENSKNAFAFVVMFLAMLFAVLSAWNQIDGFYITPSYSDRWIASLIVIIFFLFFLFLRDLEKCISGTVWLSILGGVSYPLYLLHNRAGRTLLEYYAAEVWWLSSVCLAIVSVIVISLLVHVLIERPIFRLVRKYV